MRRALPVLGRGALSLLIVALALLVSHTFTPPVVAQTTWVVDDDNPSCVGGIPDFSTITEAVLTASSGDTIRVCEGDYMEPTMSISDNSLTITGPGATPEHDGVATVHHSGGGSSVIDIQADYVVVQGLDLDATTYGISISGDSISIEHNEIRNATAWAVYASGTPGPWYVMVLSNDIHDSNEGVICHAYGCVIAGNTMNVAGGSAAEVIGNAGVITNNVVANGKVVGYGDDLFVADNQVSGPAVGSLLDVSGNPVSVTDNTLTNITGYGMVAEPASGPTSTSVTIARNTFSQVDAPIHLYDSNPGDGATVTATIGGSASEANTFINSGGSLGDSNYLIQMDGPTLDVNAEYNLWGLCTLAEIEQEIYHQVDDPAQGLVDFDPFIAPSGCSPVGGIAELPNIAESRGSQSSYYIALAVTAALLALTAGAWYARRRWLG